MLTEIFEFYKGYTFGAEYRRLLKEIRESGAGFMQLENPHSVFYERGEGLKARQPTNRMASFGSAVGQLIQPLDWYQNARCIYGHPSDYDVHVMFKITAAK